MTHVVTERCVDCRFVDCARVCPVDCFYNIAEPAMLVINPDECIDCKACVPECPVAAVYPDDEVPAEYAEWTEKNAELWENGEQVEGDTDMEKLPQAIDLDAIHEREKARGWDISDPSDA